VIKTKTKEKIWKKENGKKEKGEWNSESRIINSELHSSLQGRYIYSKRYFLYRLSPFRGFFK